MKQATISLFFLLCFTIAAHSQKAVPDVKVKTLNGQVVNLKDYIAKSGKIIIIDFWATWCSPCKLELDVLSDYYEEWQDKYGVELLAITIDNQRGLAEVPSAISSKGWPYTFFAGNEEDMRNAFNFQTIPQTLVADKNGHIIFEHNGYVVGDEEELEKAVAKAAGK